MEQTEMCVIDEAGYPGSARINILLEQWKAERAFDKSALTVVMLREIDMALLVNRSDMKRRTLDAIRELDELRRQA